MQDVDESWQLPINKKLSKPFHWIYESLLVFNQHARNLMAVF